MTSASPTCYDMSLKWHPHADSVIFTLMNIALPEPLEARLTPDRAALHLAIGLFVAEEATLGQAAEAAGLSQGDFMRELGRRKIPLHYGVEDFEQDIERRINELTSGVASNAGTLRVERAAGRLVLAGSRVVRQADVEAILDEFP